MAEHCITFTTRSRGATPTGTTTFLQVDEGPIVQVPTENFWEIFHLAETMLAMRLVMTPVAGTSGQEESIRVPLIYPVHAYLPKACLSGQAPPEPQAIPGKIGALCLAVGGVDVLATMMGVSSSEIAAWAENGLPPGPPQILIARIAEGYGLFFDRIPHAKRIEHPQPEAK
jgi:hypothetical protein